MGTLKFIFLSQFKVVVSSSFSCCCEDKSSVREKGLIWLTVRGTYDGVGSGQLELAATGHAVFTVRGSRQ